MTGFRIVIPFNLKGHEDVWRIAFCHMNSHSHISIIIALPNEAQCNAKIPGVASRLVSNGRCYVIVAMHAHGAHWFVLITRYNMYHSGCGSGLGNLYMWLGRTMVHILGGWLVPRLTVDGTI